MKNAKKSKLIHKEEMKKEIKQKKQRKSIVYALTIAVILILAAASAWIYFNYFKKQELSFELVSRGYVSGHTARINYVIEDAFDFKNLWNLTYSNIKPFQEPPMIDFSNYSIVAAYQGGLDCIGPSITIKKIDEYGKKVVIYLEEIKTCSDRRAFSQPFYIARTKKIDLKKKIEFVYLSI